MKASKWCFAVAFVFLAAVSGASAQVVFQDDFSGIANGQPDPDWQNLVGDWVVQDGQYACGAGAGPWQWSVVKDLTMGNVIVSTDIVAIDVGILVRVQNPTVGAHPLAADQFVLLGVDAVGIHLYRGAWVHQVSSGWTDAVNHSGHWAHVEISMIGEQFTAYATIPGTAATASISRNLPGIPASGAIGYYGFQNRPGKYDNFVVAVPEPGALAALSTGLLGLIGFGRMRRRR